SRVQPGAPGMGWDGMRREGRCELGGGLAIGRFGKRRFTPHSTTLREGGYLRVCVRNWSEGVLVAFGCAAGRGAGASARAIRSGSTWLTAGGSTWLTAGSDVSTQRRFARSCTNLQKDMLDMPGVSWLSAAGTETSASSVEP